MKIGILTIHHAYNFGAMLQAYATFKKISDMGYDAELVDYDNKTFSEERNVFLPFDRIGNALRNCRSMLQYCQMKHRIEKYEKFYKKFKVGSKHYNTETIKEISGYDIMLTGSDQTFALYLTGNPGEMKTFFQEGIQVAKKVSYASSMGEKFSLLTKSDNRWIKKCLNEFDCLAVRDTKSADYIESLLGKRPEVVLDPTLLLDEKQWTEEMAPVEKSVGGGNFIAFYTVPSAPWVIHYVEELKRVTGLKIIAMHPRTRYELHASFEYIGALGPGEFLTMIRNAKYVVTTSFHATIFSIIFKKSFASLLIGEGNRQKSLLQTLDLTSQIITKDTPINFDWLATKINYNHVGEKLQKERAKSISYLKKALEIDFDFKKKT